MKIYKEKTEAPSKKEMFLKLIEDDDGEINIIVCDKDGDNEVRILWFSFLGKLNRFSCAEDELKENNYDTQNMTFNDKGQIEIG